jgi:hypothetical protein
MINFLFNVMRPKFNFHMWQLKGDDVRRQIWKGFGMELSRWIAIQKMITNGI